MLNNTPCQNIQMKVTWANLLKICIFSQEQTILNFYYFSTSICFEDISLDLKHSLLEEGEKLTLYTTLIKLRKFQDPQAPSSVLAIW